jgi:transposase-like protein
MYTKLSPTDKETIVTELQSGTATIKDLATRYGVHRDTISLIFKQMTGKSLQSRLSPTDKETIVTELQSRIATIEDLATRYGVHINTIRRISKRITGKSLYSRNTVKTAIQIQEQKNMLSGVSTLQNCRYRAWHKEERKMYPVLGLDWFNQKVLIGTNGVPAWYPMTLFVIMRYSGLRDRKRTPEYPEGQKIYTGDIVQFPISLDGKKTEIKDVVAFDQETSLFIVADLEEDGDPLCFHNYECEVIGTIQENPELLGSRVQRIHALLKKKTFE